MMFKNLIRVASGYGARSNFKEIITINVNKTDSDSEAVGSKGLPNTNKKWPMARRMVR